MEIAEEARVWCERRPGPSREGGQYCWADVRGEGGPTTGASFSALSLRWQGTSKTSSRGRYEPLLSSQTPEAGSDCWRGSVTRSQPLLLSFWEPAWAVCLHTPYQEDNGQHRLRKETASLQTKNSLHTKKMLNHSSYTEKLLHINSP